MLVILRENVKNLGLTGDIVKVSDGYARNFLIPKNLVSVADEKNVVELEHHKRVLAKKREQERSAAEKIAEKIADFTCTIKRKSGKNDKLFGSVTTADIAKCLVAAGFEVERKDIKLEGSVKRLGDYNATLKLEAGVTGSFKVCVVREEEAAE